MCISVALFLYVIYLFALCSVMTDEQMSIKVNLSKEQTRVFLLVKKYLMLENNTDVIRTLIREKYEEIKEKEKE